MTAHSKIGPSALHRLIACPASYKLAEGYDGSGSSSYAAEGTVAHGIVEDCIRNGNPLPQQGTVIEEGHTIDVNADMLGCVTHMIKHCEALMADAAKVWIEQKVDIGPLWHGDPPLPIFGTVDFGAWFARTKTLHVVDYKHGRLPVWPQDNPQGLAYALGMVYELGRVPDKVVITIIQPRGKEGPVIKTWEITGLDLIIWGDDVMRPGVDKCFDDLAPFATGDHCRFCPAKIDCPALFEQTQQVARTDFTKLPPDPMTFTDDELSNILDHIEVINMWFEQVRAEASHRIEKGKSLPNWKMVPKRAMRRWTDEAEVQKLLTDPDYYTHKLLSPTQVEKQHPTVYKGLENAKLIEKKSSGTTLAPESDPREAILGRSGSDDFERIE